MPLIQNKMGHWGAYKQSPTQKKKKKKRKKGSHTQINDVSFYSIQIVTFQHRGKNAHMFWLCNTQSFNFMVESL